jgi:hypothetical protein
MSVPIHILQQSPGYLRVFPRRLRLGLLLLLLVVDGSFLTDLIPESGDFLDDHLLHAFRRFFSFKGEIERLQHDAYTGIRYILAPARQVSLTSAQTGSS